MISQSIWQWDFCENWYNYSKIDIETQNSKNRQDVHYAEQIGTSLLIRLIKYCNKK